MVGVMCSVGGGLGWAVSPESDWWGLSPSLRPPERGLLASKPADLFKRLGRRSEGGSLAVSAHFWTRRKVVKGDQ